MISEVIRNDRKQQAAVAKKNTYFIKTSVSESYINGLLSHFWTIMEKQILMRHILAGGRITERRRATYAPVAS